MYTRGVNRTGPNAGLAWLGPNFLTGPARPYSGQAEQFLNSLAIRAGLN